MIKPQRYCCKPNPVEAFLVTRENAKTVSDWCGGQMQEQVNQEDRTDVYRCVIFPTLGSSIGKVEVGQYLVRNDRGQYSVWRKEAFEEQYMEAGAIARTISAKK